MMDENGSCWMFRSAYLQSDQLIICSITPVKKWSKQHNFNVNVLHLFVLKVDIESVY